MTLNERVALLMICKLARQDGRDALAEGVDWIEAELERDEREAVASALTPRRAEERRLAGLCVRCGDDDPACICYAR